MEELAAIRREGREMTWVDAHGHARTYLRPDSKSGDGGIHPRQPSVAVRTIVVSTQHDEFITPSGTLTQEQADAAMQQEIAEDVRKVLLPASRPVCAPRKPPSSPTMWVAGQPHRQICHRRPHGDTGLTGRKIIVDTYGGRGAHGGGAFSGKRSLQGRPLGRIRRTPHGQNIVAAGIAREALVEVAYAIGRAEPVSLYVDTRGTCTIEGLTDGEISARVAALFPMRPAAIEKRFDLRKPIYRETAAYGHLGRTPRHTVKHFTSRYEGPKDIEVDLFPWGASRPCRRSPRRVRPRLMERHR